LNIDEILYLIFLLWDGSIYMSKTKVVRRFDVKPNHFPQKHLAGVASWPCDKK
jgi:hypothetical protein